MKTSILAFAFLATLHSGICQQDGLSDDERIKQALEAITAINTRLRDQIALDKSRPYNELEMRPSALATPKVAKVPARIAILVRSLENHLGMTPATVVIDGSYLEVFPSGPVDDKFLSALAKVSKELGLVYDLQVEQLGPDTTITKAEAYRRSISKFGAEDVNLALVSRKVNKAGRVRFTFSPKRLAPRLSSNPPSLPTAQKASSAKQTPIAAAQAKLPINAKATPDLSDKMANLPPGPVSEFPAPAVADAPNLPSQPRVSAAANSARPASPAPPTAVSPLPEPGVIVVELPRDRGKIQSSQSSSVVGVIAGAERP